MTLEHIEKQLIESFDFEKVINILEKLGERYSKKDLIHNAKGLIKMAYTSREMDDVFFEAAYLIISRSYYQGEEVTYNLSFSFEVNSEYTQVLENPFSDDLIDNNNEILKKQLENLLELNRNEYEKNEDNSILGTNIYKIEKILQVLD